MKTRHIILSAALLLATAVLPAQEWSGDLTTGFGISGSVPGASTDPSMNVSERLGLSADLPLGPGSGLEIKLNGSARYAFDNKTLKLTGDLNRLRYFTAIPGGKDGPTWNFELGRMAFGEPSGYVLNTTADGLKVEVKTSDLQFSVFGAYTGLLLKDTAPLILSKADLDIFLDTKEYLGSKRVLGQAMLTVPRFLDQKLSLSFTLQQDLNTLGALATKAGASYGSSLGGSYDSQYTTLALSGLVAKGLVYNGSFTYQSGNTFTNDGADKAKANAISAYAGALGLDWFNPEFLSMALSLKGVYASGDSDATAVMEGNAEGAFTLFAPLSPSGFASAYSPGFSNLASISLGASIKPLAGLDLQTGLKTFSYFRPVQGASGASGILANSASPYLGTGIDLTSTYRIVEDLVLSLNGGVFLPARASAGAFPQDAADLMYAAQASLKLEF